MLVEKNKQLMEAAEQAVQEDEVRMTRMFGNFGHFSPGNDLVFDASHGDAQSSHQVEQLKTRNKELHAYVPCLCISVPCLLPSFIVCTIQPSQRTRS